MSRKTYYYIISIVFIAIPLYFLLTWILRSSYNIELFNKLGYIKLLLAITIAYIETLRLKKTAQYVNSVLFLIAIIGYLFAVMHWPGGRLLFLGSSSIIVLVLIIMNRENKIDRLSTYILLAYPLIHLLYAFAKIYHLPGVWSLDYLAMLFLGILVLFKVKELQN